MSNTFSPSFQNLAASATQVLQNVLAPLPRIARVIPLDLRR
ncbi:MAG: hypothetical protein NT154_01380 [Verrucomicrobia bacterium]|nr:hypothetical protein [Verrucomicrobiota bacterium]